jgi:hypothetical protein
MHERIALNGIFGLIPNSTTDIHQQGPNNISSHTTKLTTLRCILIDYFNSVTSASSNNALPDDGN